MKWRLLICPRAHVARIEYPISKLEDAFLCLLACRKILRKISINYFHGNICQMTIWTISYEISINYFHESIFHIDDVVGYAQHPPCSSWVQHHLGISFVAGATSQRLAAQLARWLAGSRTSSYTTTELGYPVQLITYKYVFFPAYEPTKCF